MISIYTILVAVQVIDSRHRLLTDCEDHRHRQGDGNGKRAEKSYDRKFFIHSKHLRSAPWNLLLPPAYKDRAHSLTYSSHRRYVRRCGPHA